MPAVPITLEDLMSMDRHDLHDVLLRGHPIEPHAIGSRNYLGVDLSLPDVARRLLWHTFRKTFFWDERSSVVRGWNVKMEQHGVDGARIPKQTRDGEPVTFGHYHLTNAEPGTFPGGYRGSFFLDYGVAGNSLLDPARFGYTPLVAVNEGSQDLLLGWEVFKVGPKLVPMPLYWALRYEGELDQVVQPPR